VQKIKAISISDRKGVRKKNIDSTKLVVDFGLADDAHGGKWHRQVSFLAEESIETMREKGLDVVAGNFAENITTEGIDLTDLPVGTHVTIGDSELIISQLGKICHTRCAIYHQAGDCVMPKEGVFAIVLEDGPVKTGDSVEILEPVGQDDL
jgi:molybdopterin adenylyltransferase